MSQADVRSARAFGPGSRPHERQGPLGPDTELALGTTRRAGHESTLATMSKGRPLTDPKLGPMRLHSFHEYDSVWGDVLARAAADGVAAAEVVRRALRTYLGGSLKDDEHDVREDNGGDE